MDFVGEEEFIFLNLNVSDSYSKINLNDVD